MKKIFPVILTVLSCNAMAATTLTNVTIITGGNSGAKYNAPVHKMHQNKMIRHDMHNYDNVAYDDMFENRHMEHAKHKRGDFAQRDNWYIAARAELAFWNFKAKASVSEPGYGFGPEESESYSFKPVFGGNLSVGKWFNNNWRGDIELGYLGYMSDKDSGGEFAVQTPYAMLNGYYNFDNGLYLGAGAGVAMPIMTIDSSANWIDDNRNKAGVGFMGGVMFGYSTALSDTISLDLRYRLAGITGTSHERDYRGNDGIYTAKVKDGFMLSNSISLGLRFNF